LRVTPYTVVEPMRLAAQLAEIRRTGVAWTREEKAMGASSVAVAVTTDAGIAPAVGLLVPSIRANVGTGLPALRAAAAAIGAELRSREASDIARRRNGVCAADRCVRL
jgi:DNA-binding IclR family transcriptional regulator